MVIYAQQTDAAQMDSAALSDGLDAVLRHAMPWLVTISEAEASVPEAEGKWSAKQIIGHLTDSAVNNLARMVRMQIAGGLTFSGYEQREWVDLQHYEDRRWPEVLALWFALNEHVSWTMRHADNAALGNVGNIEGSEITLGFLMADYVAHMEHHLRAMRLWVPKPA